MWTLTNLCEIQIYGNAWWKRILVLFHFQLQLWKYCLSLPGSCKLDDSCLLATLLCDTCHCTGLEENTVFGFIWLPMMPKSFCKKMQTLACDFVCQNETHDFSWFLIILLSLRQTLHSWKTNCDTRFCCYLSWSEG